MATQQEVLTEIRDAAHINQHALQLILEEAQGHYNALRLWNDSSVKLQTLNQLASTIQSYRNAQREAADLRDAANEALQSYSEDPVPPPPDYPDIDTAGGVAQWSARDW